MAQLTKRQKKIIALISNHHAPITGKEVAQLLNVSVRTIQSDISSINKNEKIIDSSHKGYILIKDYKDIEDIKPDFNDEHFILNHLLITDHSFQIDEFADSLFMSRSSLESKLKKCNLFLKSFDLKIEKNKNYIFVLGKESDKRRCIKELIIRETRPTFTNIQNLEIYFSDIDVNRIEKIVLSTMQNHGYTIEEPYQTNVIINTVIALHRMKSHHYVEDASEHKVDHSESYMIAKEICEIYANHWSIHPMEEDILYISALLIGQMKPISTHTHNMSHTNIISSSFINDIQTILDNVFMSYSLHIDSTHYLYGFAVHIDSMIRRIKSDYPANNELLDNVKKNCPFIYDVSVKIAHQLEKQFYIQIPDSEIGYICIHIGFLIESSIDQSSSLDIALYGTEYHQILSNIKNKLESEYSHLINLTLIDSSQLSLLSHVKWDLIITTHSLEILGQNIIMISPFYTSEDQTNVNLALKNCIAIKEKKKQSDLFSTYFHENLWFQKDDFTTKDEVIQFLGHKLIDEGIVQSDFIHSVLERERLSSTCFYGNFAIPHSLEMNAKKTTICVLISRSKIQWDHQFIHVVLMIAVQNNDRDKFMELYNGIVKVLKHQKNIAALIEAKTFHQFIHSLQQNL